MTAVPELLEDAVREHWGRLVALLVARFRRLDLAEDGLADAVEAAARTWADDPPDNPAGWLLTAARRRILDRLRAEAVAARTFPRLIVEHQVQEGARSVWVDPGDELRDERLRLVLLCAHPSLGREAAVALTLRLVLGVATSDIARLFLVSTPTMAARLTRARKSLAWARFEVPPPAELPERLAAVADVAYLAFTAGYAPPSGEFPLRADLAREAIRLVRVVRSLVPPDPDLDALQALMLLQHSRRDARVAADGDLVLLGHQDRTLWNGDEIAEALALLTPLATRQGSSWVLQAVIAACHAVAPSAADTDWKRIATLYAELEQLTGSPVVRLNRAVAVAESQGPAAGLALLDELDLPGHRLPAVRAELLGRQGDQAAARTAYREAIAACQNDSERRHLERRLAAQE